jgi:hypothetical protein
VQEYLNEMGELSINPQQLKLRSKMVIREYYSQHFHRLQPRLIIVSVVKVSPKSNAKQPSARQIVSQASIATPVDHT